MRCVFRTGRGFRARAAAACVAWAAGVCVVVVVGGGGGLALAQAAGGGGRGASSTTAPAAGAAAAPQPGTGLEPPPPYTSVRWNENYTYLRDPAKRTDPWDPVKYVPLNTAGDWYLSLGAQARYRYELFNNNTFGAGPQDDTGYHLGRGLAHADLHLGGALRLFVQVKTALEDGRAGGPRGTDEDVFDVQQAFIDLKLPLPLGGEGDGASVTLRGGRQELIHGAQRLIGPVDWTNVRRTFEGGKAMVSFSKTHNLDLFWVRPVVSDPEEPNVGDPDANFAGVYDTIGLPGVFGAEANTKLELYAFGLFRQEAGYPPEGTGQDEDRYTVGTRFAAAPKPIDFDVEATYQFGDFGGGGGDISAWSLAAEGGYTLAEQPLTPRLFAGFDIASGDDDPGDGDVGTFNQLFPTAHVFFGYIDAIGRQNIVDLHPGVDLTLLTDARWARRVTLRAEHHWFWRQSEDDAVYNAGGGVLRADAGSDETYIGSEIDLLLNWQIDRHTAAYVGYSHFFAGDFLSDTGPDDDIDFVYAAVTYTF